MNDAQVFDAVWRIVTMGANGRMSRGVSAPVGLGYHTAVEADEEKRNGAPSGPMTARDLYALWLTLVRDDLTEGQAAERYGLDLPTVRRIRQVAEQGALSALSASEPDATAQVAAPTGPPDTAGERVVDILHGSPVFYDVPRARLEALARGATLAFLGERTPVADTLAAAPLLVAEGTLLAVDAVDRPIDLVGRRAFRAPRAGRRLVPLTTTRVAVLPASAVEEAAAGTRRRLAAATTVGATTGIAEGPAPAVAAMVVGDLVDGAPVHDDPDETGATARDRLVPVNNAPAGSVPYERRLRLEAGTPLLDALVRMLETGISDVVVTEAGAAGGGTTGWGVLGAFSAEDLPLPRRARLVDLLTDLAGSGTVSALAAVVPSARSVVRALLAAGADIDDAGCVFAAVSDGLIRRLLAVARVELGDPPGDYAWLVFGSQARREQTPGSDQDTGLVHAAGLDAAGREWFARLGEWMTQALEECGYRRCPGGVMASRADWRNDLDGWARTVGGWADPADSTRLVGVDIGFDVRAVEGVGDLAAGDVAERFSRMVADATRSELTAARLARAAVASRPPSPVWGRVGRNPLGPLGSRHRRFDIKRHGVQPIVDLARVYTLVRGGTEVGTAQRLAAAAAEGQLGPDLAATLVEGLRLLTWTRLSAQLGDVDGADGDHHVDWTALPGPLRTQFSDTFGAIRTAQDALRGRYHLPPGA